MQVDHVRTHLILMNISWGVLWASPGPYLRVQGSFGPQFGLKKASTFYKKLGKCKLTMYGPI